MFSLRCQSHGHLYGIVPYLLRDVKGQDPEHGIVNNSLLLRVEVGLGFAQIVQIASIAYIAFSPHGRLPFHVDKGRVATRTQRRVSFYFQENQ